MRNILCLLTLTVAMLTACGPNEPQQNNPKFADVKVEGDQVTVEFPGSTRYFYIENVNDESVPYEQITFQFDPDEDAFYYRLDLGDWQPVPSDGNEFELGMVLVEFGEKDTTITYPSGTWAFP